MNLDSTNNDSNVDKNLETAKQLIEKIKEQLGYENEKIMEYKKEMYKERDFKVRKFYSYSGPNFYLDSKALVFNLFIAPTGDSVDFFKSVIVKDFPALEKYDTPYVVDLFAQTLLHVLKMDIDLYINKYRISTDSDEYVIAIEYLDRYIAEEAAYLVSDWFKAISIDKKLDFQKEYIKLQAEFDKSLFGGPTLYSLVEAGLKRQIPVFFLKDENQFQWGYGKKQLRGRSTTFHVDGIKDTEFTMFKDMVGEFLDKCGFPTPQGKNCFDEEEIVEEALKLGFPCVVKPVAGHKGQGVTTGIMSEEEVRKAFNSIVLAAKTEGVQFDGALVQQQIYGTDHRLLAVEGKFVAALERVPAYVKGNDKDSIEKLIEEENKLIIRLDNARSPLCKIKIDETLKDYLSIQNLTLSYIPKQDEVIQLRRVANISAGGVSINVTDKIHPINIKLVEDIACFFSVKCLGIDVLSADISKPWTEGNFGIIEINAGPGVFMHLAPAYGGSIDVPGKIILSHFIKPENSRIPIISGNRFSDNFSSLLFEKLKSIKSDIFFSSLTNKGVAFNDIPFYKNPEHDKNVEIILRHPKTEFALFKHISDDIYDFGLLHQGSDIVIMEDAEFAEETVLKEQILNDGYLVQIDNNQMYLKQNDAVINTSSCGNDDSEKDRRLLELIEPLLKDLIYKYEL